ncbi:uncharacterized protein LOC106079375 [Biomphalaria glabrata]|uniref:Uncharacterized protein LOC106079375 n=1 Tax=Biomphalaria glabrata TaxID=6526 RepID=A0A9W2ZA13_BIOGL|nr:uncharacterized protein LOC106079375 [Biomphalaria glabrata]
MVESRSFTFVSLLVAMVIISFLSSSHATYSRGGRRGSVRHWGGERGRHSHGNGTNSVWDFIRKLQQTLNNLEKRLNNEEKAGCMFDSPNIVICKNEDDTDCYEGETDADNSTRIIVPVVFNQTFANSPAVMVSFSAIQFVEGQTLELNSYNVTTTGFDIEITSSGPTPSELFLSWIACKQVSG